MVLVSIKREVLTQLVSRLDELKVTVGVCIALLPHVATRYESDPIINTILRHHMFELLGDVEGELETIRDTLVHESVPL